MAHNATHNGNGPGPDGNNGLGKYKGTPNDDTIVGSAGGEIIDGRDGDDRLEGLGGNDTILGGLGNDTLIGGEGNDSLTGDDGADVFRFDGLVLGDDVITDYLVGIDSLVLPDFVETLTIVDTPDGALVTFGGVGSTGSILFTGLTADQVTPELVREQVGTAGNDSLTGDGRPDVVGGGGADDTLNGGEGADVLSGGDGNDLFLLGTPTNSTADGGEGTDTASFADAWIGVEVNLLSGTAAARIDALGRSDSLTGIENIIGSAHADLLIGDAGHNVIDAGVGDDIIQSSGGCDTLTGGAGSDWFAMLPGVEVGPAPDLGAPAPAGSVAGGALETIITDFDMDEDRLVLLTGTILTQSIETTEAGTDTIVTDGVVTFRLVGVSEPVSIHYLPFGVRVGDPPDLGGTIGMIITGSDAADTLEGGNGNDLIDGLGGSDLLYGRSKDDTLLGGAGDDTLYGESGSDLLLPGSGSGFVDGGSGMDTLSYEGLNESQNLRLMFHHPYPPPTADGFTEIAVDVEHVIGSEAGDTITGSDFLDSIETIEGRGGADFLYGNAGDDVLLGGAGNDIVNAGDGNDTLDGGEGDDLLEAGFGENVMSGGSGADQFIFITTTGTAYSTISDWEDGIDMVRFGSPEAEFDPLEGAREVSTVSGSGLLLSYDGSFLLIEGASLADFDTADFTVLGVSPPPGF